VNIYCGLERIASGNRCLCLADSLERSRVVGLFFSQLARDVGLHTI